MLKCTYVLPRPQFNCHFQHHEFDLIFIRYMQYLYLQINLLKNRFKYIYSTNLHGHMVLVYTYHMFPSCEVCTVPLC